MHHLRKRRISSSESQDSADTYAGNSSPDDCSCRRHDKRKRSRRYRRSLSARKMNSMVILRVSVFKNGSRNGELLPLENSLDGLLRTVNHRLGVNGTILFTANGEAIHDINRVRDNDTLFVSNGEPFSGYGPQPGYNNYGGGYRGPGSMSGQHSTNPLVAPGTVTTNGGQGQAQPNNSTSNNNAPVPSGSNPPGFPAHQVDGPGEAPAAGLLERQLVVFGDAVGDLHAGSHPLPHPAPQEAAGQAEARAQDAQAPARPCGSAHADAASLARRHVPNEPPCFTEVATKLDGLVLHSNERVYLERKFPILSTPENSSPSECDSDSS